MSILSWNCQGAGSPETVLRLREIRRVYFPDLLFLTETKQKSGYVEKLKLSLGYDECLTVDPIGLSGGLAVMWKSSYMVEVVSCDNRIIDLKVSLGSLSFFLTCVYGDPVRERRNLVWDRLTSIGVQRNDAWALIGDFNELMHGGEKLGGVVRNDSTYWDFRNMAEACKIKEHISHGNLLSWAAKRDNIWVQCRLDRSFGNDAWFRLFPRSRTEYMDMRASDHRPIRMEFALEVEEKNRVRFVFDKRLIGKRGVEEAVIKGWLSDGSGGDTSLLDRIAKCRTELSKIKRSQHLNSRTRMDKLKHALEVEIAKEFPNFHTMRKLKHELAIAVREEESFWLQRSRVEWLKDGDLNTAYFHNVVRGKRLRNKVLMLKDIFGNENYSEGSKGNIAVEFYRDLFMSSNPTDMEELFEGLQAKVTPSMNAMLTKPVSTEDIRIAAFGVKGSSAPGEDGLTGLFYQKFWHIVGPKVISDVQGFFQSAVIPEGWNHTQLSLLPKTLNPYEMKDMRPISLCSVQYKIISRILCDRLKVVLPDLISETQGAFVSERLITDNVIIAHELMHGLRTNQKVRETYMAIKTDMSKAYDRVEWNFVENLLEKLGFDRTWVRWIMACINSVTFSVLLNGRSHGFIKPERGIRQGDPLSPFLFILCAEALVGVLNRAESQGCLHGIKLNERSPAVHHLLFADDSLLMCQADMLESAEIKRCLQLYGLASGQVINYTKSSIIFGDKVPTEIKDGVKKMLGIQQEGGEGTYLGLPEVFKGSKRELLNFIKEKLEGRLQGWYSKTLSMGAKEVLIKSVALALPIYAMSVFLLPKDLCARITSVIAEFWWSSGDKRRKIPWVAWEKLCKPKEVGGMAFHDIGRFNQALLCKQAWRIWSKPDSLVAKVLRGKYFSRSSFLDCGTGYRPSFAWRSILYGRELLKQGLSRRIGNGTQTNVWAENWIIDTIPRPPMYRAESDVDLTLKVADLLVAGSDKWNLHLVRQSFSDEDAERIFQIKPKLNQEDSYCWGFTAHGCYSTQSGYRLTEAILEMNSPGHRSLPPLEKKLWRDLWKVKAPPKLKHFLWRSLSGALAVKERLQTRGIPGDSTCPLCGQAPESICHVLFTCEKARNVWDLANIPLPQQGFSRNSMFLNIYHLLSNSKNCRDEERIRMVFPWILWLIWKARNSFIFNNQQVQPHHTVAKAFEDAHLWNQAQTPAQEVEHTRVSTRWSKPPEGFLKCNVGSSWISVDKPCGVSWILRDHTGAPILHSRRAYSYVRSKEEANIYAMFWAVESMSNLHKNNVLFEASEVETRQIMREAYNFPTLQHLVNSISFNLEHIDNWSLNHTSTESNAVAVAIATSVTTGFRYQSYIAVKGPAWLSYILAAEASV